MKRFIYAGWMMSLTFTIFLALWRPYCCATSDVGLEDAGINVKSISDGISLKSIGKFQVMINVDPEKGSEPIELDVELAASGPRTWPAEDLCVVDGDGRAMPIRRNGIEWHKFSMTVPAIRGSYLVSAVPSKDVLHSVKLQSETERTASDPVTGVSASVCKWYDGRDAALSMRFDDSHPTHLSTVVPILREHGLRATFMINPGRSAFQNHRSEWEDCARSDEHEFANHTMMHRGASSEEEIEREVGQAAEYICGLFPQRSRLVALNRGGGTTWITRKPFSYYLENYHLFNVTGSLGMDDVYGKRIAALERHLLNAVKRNGWAKIHYHSIGDGLATSEDNFRAAMQLLSKRADQIWITGLADAFKYLTERSATKISLKQVDADRVELEVVCGTDPALFDQPLTIEFEAPPNWSTLQMATVSDEANPVHIAGSETDHLRTLIRYHIPPVSRCYELCRNNIKINAK
jgi:peptidoglycan/xylan/chitin deacetylase (PgdA/CDA1 family)